MSEARDRVEPAAAPSLQAPSLRAMVQHLADLKAEHRPIVARIAADAGMEPSTRALLLEHLAEEEDEHVAGLLARAAAAPDAGGTGPGGRPVRLTVGALRPDPFAAHDPRRLGALRG